MERDICKKWIKRLFPMDESLNQDEDKENLESWTYESESRLDGVLAGELGSVDYSELNKNSKFAYPSSN